MTRAMAFALICLFFDCPAYARDVPDDTTDPTGIYLELSGGSDPDMIGGELGLFGYTGNHLSLRGGVAFLASERFDDVFGGANAGVRLSLFSHRTVATPFIGMGLFGGYTKKKESADNDGEDNDEDGRVDESGEEKDVIDDVIACIYPEAGVRIRLSPQCRLTVSGRYLVTTEGRENDSSVFNLGVVFEF
ncbi:hypothetical protein JCM14469_10560 [Desulfatiferula olefinivorans]